MSKLWRILKSTSFLWVLLSLPWAVMTAQYANGGMIYGEFLHATGEFSARLLILAMAVTPLRLMFPNHRWPIWLLQKRRYFGVAAFAYAVPHMAVYLYRVAPARAASEALEPGMWTGWAAFMVFLILATTSNDYAVRRLGRVWKKLHRWVYAAAVLTFAHWVLSAFDPTAGLVHLSLLAALEFFRLWKTRTA